MNNKIPCALIRDLMPLYTEDLVSAGTKEQIEEHFQECEDCRQYCERLAEKMEGEKMAEGERESLEIDYMKKIRAYQRNNTILGAAVSLLLGLLLPLVAVGASVLARGGIPDYYLARLQVAWPLGLMLMLISGAAVCVIYLIVNRLLRRKQ